jgi:UDP-3-O-[3-hydroxymyristoyl] glucosamine N-acyltransferase
MARRTLSDLAQLCGARLEGDGGVSVDGAASLPDAGATQISFCTSPRYAAQLDATRAAAVVVPPALRERRSDLPRLVHADPNAAFTRICAAFAPPPARAAPGVDASARIAAGARLAQDVAVGPLCSVAVGSVLGERCVLHAGVHVGADCVLGPDCELFPGVVLYPGVRLGARVRVHAGAVLGADGFGYEPPRARGGTWSKIPHVGTVEIGDDVEIGVELWGTPAQPRREVLKQTAELRRLGELRHRLEALERRLEQRDAGANTEIRT